MSDDEKTNNNDAQHEQHDFEEVCLLHNPIDRAYSEADRERLPFPLKIGERRCICNVPDAMLGAPQERPCRD